MSVLGIGLPSKRSLNQSAMNVPVAGPFVVEGAPLTLCSAPSYKIICFGELSKSISCKPYSTGES